jgi:hypothetical protein
MSDSECLAVHRDCPVLGYLPVFSSFIMPGMGGLRRTAGTKTVRVLAGRCSIFHFRRSFVKRQIEILSLIAVVLLLTL